VAVSSFYSLPVELLEHLGSFLSLRNLMQLKLVCSYLWEHYKTIIETLAKQEQSHMQINFGRVPLSLRRVVDTWRGLPLDGRRTVRIALDRQPLVLYVGLFEPATILLREDVLAATETDMNALQRLVNNEQNVDRACILAHSIPMEIIQNLALHDIALRREVSFEMGVSIAFSMPSKYWKSVALRTIINRKNQSFESSLSLARRIPSPFWRNMTFEDLIHLEEVSLEQGIKIGRMIANDEIRSNAFRCLALRAFAEGKTDLAIELTDKIPYDEVRMDTLGKITLEK
jgi:hypothetical protein